MITITKTATGFSAAFPFGLKDDFRATFPSAKWNPEAKVWTVGPRSGKRLEAWAAENGAAAEAAAAEGARAYAERQAARAAREAQWAKEREERRAATREEYAQERAAKDERMDRVRAGRVIFDARQLPNIGSEITVHGENRTVELIGRAFRLNDDLAGAIGKPWLGEEWVAYVYTQPATVAA